ncbi:hypothetical protein U1Q18_021666 [Sarracenia purpurea var. burkii]
MERYSKWGWLGFRNDVSQGGSQAKRYGIWSAQAWIKTIFIDNIPNTIDNRRLGHIFKHCGVVGDAFVSVTRRRRTKSRFGFVMFGKHGSALAAINCFDDAWLLNHKLRVTLAHSNLFQGAKRRWTLYQSGGHKQFKVKRVQGIAMAPTFQLLETEYRRK